ncbi:hypothetical protein M3Y97_00540900 [Aphelenchoides bicaudatus]|nr:hypothetical protein M3Y97_00540900 [Aphelenchoides bicaudatus]
MTINNVFASRVDSYISDIGDESVLNRLVACKRANFTTRIDATQHIYGSKEAYINTTNKLKTAVSFKNAFLAEKRVFNSFLNRCGILNIADDDQAFRASLTDKFFAYWMACEIGYNTVKYKGFASKKAYDIDDAYLIANEDLLMDYMGQFGYFYDPLAIKDVKMEMCTVIMEKAKRMHELRICEVEMTAVLWLLLLRAAMSIHSMPSYFKQEASKLFADLTKFYASKYENSAERIGNLMLFIDMIEDIKKVKSEVATIIELNLIPLNVILAAQRRNQLTQ